MVAVVVDVGVDVVVDFVGRPRERDRKEARERGRGGLDGDRARSCGHEIVAYQATNRVEYKIGSDYTQKYGGRWYRSCYVRFAEMKLSCPVQSIIGRPEKASGAP